MRKKEPNIRKWEPVAIHAPTSTRQNGRSFQKVLEIASSNQKRAAFRGWLKRQVGPEALEAFDSLVSQGCNPEELLTALAALAIGYEYHWQKEPEQKGPERNPSPLRFDELFGFDGDTLGTVLKRMHQCAQDMERLLRHLGRDQINRSARAACTERMQSLKDGEQLPSTEITSVGPSFAVELVNIPAQLRLFSKAVKKLSADADFRSRPLYDEALVVLMRLVIRGTGHERYSKVAALVGAVRGQCYDPAALKNWWTKRRSPSQHT